MYFAKEFVKRVENTIFNYDDIRVAFDTYKADSLKSQTSAKRNAGVEARKFIVKCTTNIKRVTIRTFLSPNETKSQLTEYLGNALLKAYEASSKKVVVTFGNNTYCNHGVVFTSDIASDTNEEADTMIPFHALNVLKSTDQEEGIDMYSPDTDLFFVIDGYGFSL